MLYKRYSLFYLKILLSSLCLLLLKCFWLKELRSSWKPALRLGARQSTWGGWLRVLRLLFCTFAFRLVRSEERRVGKEC